MIKRIIFGISFLLITTFAIGCAAPLPPQDVIEDEKFSFFFELSKEFCTMQCVVCGVCTIEEVDACVLDFMTVSCPVLDECEERVTILESEWVSCLSAWGDFTCTEWITDELPYECWAIEEIFAE